jgi:hypothetical protein
LCKSASNSWCATAGACLVTVGVGADGWISANCWETEFIAARGALTPLAADEEDAGVGASSAGEAEAPAPRAGGARSSS